MFYLHVATTIEASYVKFCVVYHSKREIICCHILHYKVVSYLSMGMLQLGTSFKNLNVSLTTKMLLKRRITGCSNVTELVKYTSYS